MKVSINSHFNNLASSISLASRQLRRIRNTLNEVFHDISARSRFLKGMPIITVDFLDQCPTEANSWLAVEPAYSPRSSGPPCFQPHGAAVRDRRPKAQAFQETHRSRPIGSMQPMVLEKLESVGIPKRTLVLLSPQWNTQLKVMANPKVLIFPSPTPILSGLGIGVSKPCTGLLR